MKTFKMTVYVQLLGEGWDDKENGFETYPVDEEVVEAHVQDAARCWGGQYHPGDPMFPGNIVIHTQDCKLLKKNRRLPHAE